MNRNPELIEHDVDFCVVGGGLAGMLAAIAAARNGARVAIMQDRPVFGGNCSSEIRMWTLGCHGENNRETGILEEILLENMDRNPQRNFSVWDSILYEKIRFQPGIEMILNCSCQEAEMDGARIRSVTGWQLTTYTRHRVHAKLFADCSGDSVLAPLTGAIFRVGREARSEFGEDIEPEQSDSCTMGLSCLLQARETDHRVNFKPPKWAHVYQTDEEINRAHDFLSDRTENFWWIELGGTGDSIRDTEQVRDELLRVTFGIWDHIKNRGDHGADNWELEWVGFLPGKRESRRYVGDVIVTENDVAAGGHFEDVAAYGGWTMDDHDPRGFCGERGNVFHPAPCPFGIPYRAMYSVNVENLFCAGRNISATHAAMSATRVMATCATIGQAVGTAAAIAARDGLTPRGVYEQRLEELLDRLQFDDAWLPFRRRAIPALTEQAAATHEVLRNGYDRPQNGQDNGCRLAFGKTACYDFGAPRRVRVCRIILDSDLERTSCDGDATLRTYPMVCNKYRDVLGFGFPKTMLRSFRLEYRTQDGEWKLIEQIDDNIRRLVVVCCNVCATAVRFIPLASYGSADAHIFSFDVR